MKNHLDQVSLCVWGGLFWFLIDIGRPHQLQVELFPRQEISGSKKKASREQAGNPAYGFLFLLLTVGAWAPILTFLGDGL